MLIDAHAHVFMNPQIRLFPGHTTLMSVVQQLAVMDRMGVNASVILPLVNPESTCETQSIGEILTICRDYPGRFIPFCNVDPRLTSTFFAADVQHFIFVLEQFKAIGCKGLGELAARIYWDDPRVSLLFEACQKVGFPVTFHTTIEESKDYGLIDENGISAF
jgi:predicted TIM-barrel fold metal-dependent hydrolase